MRRLSVRLYEEKVKHCHRFGFSGMTGTPRHVVPLTASCSPGGSRATRMGRFVELPRRCVVLTRRRVSTGARNASGDRQLPARIRRLLDGIDEAVQIHRGVERGRAVLTGADRLGEQGIHLPDIERIAAREVGRDIHEALGDLQVAQRMVATRALQA